MNKPKINIIIITYNRGEYLDLTLAGYVNQTENDFEIIVIDGASTDTTQDVINKYKRYIKINHIQVGRVSRSEGRNIALNNCTSKYIIIADDDRIPCNTFVSNHYDKINKKKNIVSIGRKGTLYTKYSPEIIYKPQYLSQIPKDRLNICKSTAKMLVTSHEIINDFDTILREVYAGESRDNYFDVINSFGSQLRGFDMGWAIATTGNLAINIENAKHILFEENFQGWGMEDTEFAYQLHKLGYGFEYNFDAINFHQQHERPKSNMDDLKKNMKYFIKKHSTIEAYLFLMIFAIEDYSFGVVDSNNLLKLYNYTESKEIELIVKYMVDTYLNI